MSLIWHRHSSPNTLKSWSRASLVLLACLSLCACGKKAPEDILSEANQLFEARDIFGAEVKYEEFLEKYPDSELAIYAKRGLAMCYQVDKQYDQARTQWDAVMQAAGGAQTPMGFEALNWKVRGYLDENQTQAALNEALTTSETMTNLPPEGQYQFKSMLAELYLLNQQEDEFLAMMNTLIEQGPSGPQHLPVVERLVQLYSSRQEYDKAVEVYDHYLALYPDSELKGIMLFGVGVYEEKLGHTDLALKSFEASEQEIQSQLDKAVGADAKCDWLFKQSRLRQYRRDFDRARQSLQTIVDSYPESKMRPLAMMQLSDLALEDGQTSQSVQILEEVSQAYPGTQIAYQAYQRIQQIRSEAQGTTGTMSQTDVTSAPLTLAVDESTTATTPTL